MHTDLLLELVVRALLVVPRVARAHGHGAGLQRRRHAGAGRRPRHAPVRALLAVAHYLVALLALLCQTHLHDTHSKCQSSTEAPTDRTIGGFGDTHPQ